ncbi:MAG: hypothetical protein NC228_10735, partial [[Eubacterium] siraeum]|nr:hypothetical protein [[Eubacterium] siraeum]
VLAGAAVVLFSYMCTGKIRKFSPIDAIHSGETGESFKKKGVLHLGGLHMPVLPFMALNDIFSGARSYISMIIIFILGTLLVIIPVNTINTLRCDRLIRSFNMAECDHVIAASVVFDPNKDNKAAVERQFDEIREMFREKGIEAEIFREIMFRGNISKGDSSANSLSLQGLGGVTTDMYSYLKGTPPQNSGEVALTYIIADQIGAEIGDRVKIKIGEDTRTYTVSAIYESMTNMGEGIRFYQEAELDYRYAIGSFGTQVKYKDNPDAAERLERKAMLEELYENAKIFTPGEYIGFMVGGVADTLDSLKLLILTVVLFINMLVAVLMVKSFIAKEKGEIALLKAIGFKNGFLVLWQTMRIGIVLLVSVIFGALISAPLSSLVITPVFRIMGAYSIEYEIKALEVYAVFPLTVLALTALAAFISAQGLRKISSSDISNNE